MNTQLTGCEQQNSGPQPAANSPQPLSVNSFGSITVLWQGKGNYRRSHFGYGYIWQRTDTPEGTDSTKWLVLPIDALDCSWHPGGSRRPGFVGARG